jgi:hypothetical protein
MIFLLLVVHNNDDKRAIRSYIFFLLRCAVLCCVIMICLHHSFSLSIYLCTAVSTTNILFFLLYSTLLFTSLQRYIKFHGFILEYHISNIIHKYIYKKSSPFSLSLYHNVHLRCDIISRFSGKISSKGKVSECIFHVDCFFDFMLFSICISISLSHSVVFFFFAQKRYQVTYYSDDKVLSLSHSESIFVKLFLSLSVDRKSILDLFTVVLMSFNERDRDFMLVK